MFNIALKDIRLFIYDKKALLLSFLLPIALITLFAIAFGGVFSSRTESPTTLLVSDLDKTDATSDIIAEIDSLKGIRIAENELEEAKKKIREGKRIGVLVFYQGFADSINEGKNAPIELFYDPAREMQIGIMQQALISTLMKAIGTKSIQQTIKTDIADQYPSLDSEILNNIYSNIDEQFTDNNNDNNVMNKLSSGIKMTGLVKEKKSSWGLIQAVAGVAVMMLLFSVSAMGASILQEKEEGTLKRLLVSPISPFQILGGKLITAMIISTSQLIIMFVYAWLAFNLDIFIDIPSLLVMLLCTAFACASFGVFLAAISRTRKQVESMSVVVILVMSAIGGSMVPLFIMPPFMQKVAIISVNFWAIDGFYDIFWRHLPFSKVVFNAIVLTGIGAIMTFISAILFKRNIIKVI